jgi:hypothetical protein
MQKNVWISCQVSAATSAAQMPLAIPSSATTHPPGRNSAEDVAYFSKLPGTPPLNTEMYGFP